MNAELWRVQLATGEVRIMTLDDLDRAFDAGYIHARTNVLAPGALRWTTLGDAAGLEDPAEQTPSLSPMAIANGPSSYALPQITPQAGFSMRSFGVDDDFEPKKSKRGLVFGMFIAATAAACAFAVTSGRVNVSKLIAATHTEAATVAAVAPPPVQPLPAAVRPAATPVKDEAKPAAIAISDDVKKKLLDADKAREEKAAKKAGKSRRRLIRNAENDGNSVGPIPKGDGKPLVEGGDKFDPLNGSL